MARSDDGQSELHSGRLNCDRCAGTSCAQIDWLEVALAQAEATFDALWRQKAERDKAREIERKKAEVRDESVDGVHPLEA